MNHTLIRVCIVAATTVSVHAIAGLPGVVAAASLATVLVTQSEAVARILRQSGQSCAAAATRAHSVKTALAHPYVKRVARNAAFALLTSLATMLGEYVAGHVASVIVGFITATLVVSAGQSLPSKSSRG